MAAPAPAPINVQRSFGERPDAPVGDVPMQPLARSAPDTAGAATTPKPESPVKMASLTGLLAASSPTSGRTPNSFPIVSSSPHRVSGSDAADTPAPVTRDAGVIPFNVENKPAKMVVEDGEESDAGSDAEEFADPLPAQSVPSLDHAGSSYETPRSMQEAGAGAQPESYALQS
jgi:hypothetical protein